MNEQIQKLYKQAAEYAQQQEPTDLIAAQVVWHTKFAELIVKECASIAYKTAWDDLALDYGTGAIPLHIHNTITEHFGVEE